MAVSKITGEFMICAIVEIDPITLKPIQERAA